MRESHVISIAGLAPSPSGAAVPSGITYTCDPSVSAVAGVCNYPEYYDRWDLCGHIFERGCQHLYHILPILAPGDAGQSSFLPNDVSLQRIPRRAAERSLSGRKRCHQAFNASVPAANPINGAAGVFLVLPVMRALGFTPSGGMTASGGSCTGGTAGCYDGTISVSSTIQSSENFYFRSGSIGPSQYDFFTTVEHETDEIIGTASCAFGCGGSDIAPVDLFRYQSNGARSLGAGNNISCASRDRRECLLFHRRQSHAAALLQHQRRLRPRRLGAELQPRAGARGRLRGRRECQSNT